VPSPQRGAALIMANNSGQIARASPGPAASR